MPAISKIRFTNVIYENGGKRYNDMVFNFEGQNSAILLENGGGKTVFIQTAIQAIIPHVDMADRKIKNTLSLENGPAHIAIEWILNDDPRRYALTAVSLFLENNGVNSYKYVYEYAPSDKHGIDKLPYTIKNQNGSLRAASKGEISEYYHNRNKIDINAKLFDTIKGYGQYIESEFKIIPSEWRSIAEINSGEGNVDEYFNKCKTTTQLLNNLLIPVVEEAIEGDNKTAFVETFEKQREHFKKNERLQNQIYQSQLVKERLDDYVESFKAYDEALNKYNQLRVKTKDSYTIINNLKNIIIEKQALNDDKIEHLKVEQRELIRKQISYDIYQYDDQIKQIDAEKRIIESHSNEFQREIDDLKKRKQNIEIKVIKERIDNINNRINHLNEKLLVIDDDKDIQKIKKAIAENSCLLKGCFSHQLIEISHKLDEYEAQIKDKNNALTNGQEQLVEMEIAEKEFIKKQAHIEGIIHSNQLEIEQLSSSLGSEGLEVSYKSYYKQLENEAEKRAIQLKQMNTDLEKSKQQLDDLLKEKRYNDEGIINVKAELKSSKQSLENIDTLKNQLIMEIEAKGYFIHIGQGIYEKSESIANTLSEKLQKLKLEKEKAMQKERIHKRMYDLHMDSDYFFADASIRDFVKNINYVDFICLGTEYMMNFIEDYGLTNEQLFECYPYWPTTIITTKHEIDKVKNAVKAKRDHLQYPIIVLSTETIKQYIQGKGLDVLNDEKVIFPNNWQYNLISEGFDQWLSHEKEKGVKAEAKRIEIEKGYNELNYLISKVRDFYKQYPYAVYSLIENNIKTYIKELDDREYRAKANKDEIASEEEKSNQLAAKIAEENQIIKINEDQQEVIYSCIKKETIINESNFKLQKMKASEHQLVLNIEKYKQLIEKLLETIQSLNESKQRYMMAREKIEDDRLYQEVVDCEAVTSDKSIDYLKTIRDGLHDNLRGISVNRTSIENEIKSAENNLEDYKHDLKAKLKSIDYEVEEVINSYDHEIEDLIDKIKRIQPKIETLRKQINEHTRESDQLIGTKGARENDLYREFERIAVFDEPLVAVKVLLRKEKDRLAKVNLSLYDKRDDYIRRLYNVEELIKELDIENGRYMFNDFEGSEVIKELKETELKGFIDGLLVCLEEAKKISETENKMITEKRDDFIEFCKEYVTDYRLRESAISGIKLKKELKAVESYRENIGERIDRIIKILEDDKKESDVELQAFLSHLHAYIKSVATELDTIQRKTSIKIDESYKQIFIFDIPMWEEADGKDALRTYINQIVDYFDQESEKGELDEVALRSEIEKRLSVKNLLQVVMGEQSIKIKCRKVTNDMKINKAPTSWESSNRWSGGEKWSKNMTLFLSILNYVAGKKQHLNKSQKNNRAVVLDNPFGKASSNHVLNPVFKIAEKLGFQMIALTAHAEGKFISDYFPVVYSCRLRKAIDGERQVMTTDKQINVAYLREHSPKSIVALQEIEQLSLI